MSPDLGQWRPLSVVAVTDLFRDAPFRWWLTGGIALELFTGLSWRAHDDVDVGIRRVDTAMVYAHVAARLSPYVAAAGALRPWRGEDLDEVAHENNIWLRHADGPWVLDLAVGSGTDDDWVYRRDPTVRRSWSTAVLATVTGTPYLAPELQLLFKAGSARPKDEQDFAAVLPHLDEPRRSALRSLLPEGHRWTRMLA